MKSRSPFINFDNSMTRVAAISFNFGRYLYRQFNTYHDIDNGTNKGDWLITPVYQLTHKIYRFNRWWVNKLARLFCRHLIVVIIKNGEDIKTPITYIEENNPSKWFWVHVVEKKASKFSSFRYETIRIEISFMFKQEAIMYRLGKI